MSDSQEENQAAQKYEEIPQSSSQSAIQIDINDQIAENEIQKDQIQENINNVSQNSSKFKDNIKISEHNQQQSNEDQQNQNSQKIISIQASQNTQDSSQKSNNKEKKINSDMKHFLSLLQKVEEAKVKKEQLTKTTQDEKLSQQNNQSELDSNKDAQDESQDNQLKDQQEFESQNSNKEILKADNQDINSEVAKRSMQEQDSNQKNNYQKRNYHGKSSHEVQNSYQNDIDLGYNSYSMQEFERKKLEEEFDEEDEKLLEFQRLEEIQQNIDSSSKNNFEEIRDQNYQDQNEWKEMVEDENLSVIYSDANESRRSTHDNLHSQSHKEKKLIEETITLITNEIQQEDKLIPILQNFKSIQMNFISKQQLLHEENENLKLKRDQLTHKNELLEKSHHFQKQQIKHLESQNGKLLEDYEYIQREIEKMRQLEKELKHSLSEAKQMNQNFSELLRIRNEENKQKELQSKMILESYKKLGTQMSQFQQNYSSLNENIKVVVSQVLETIITDKDSNQNRLLNNFSQDSNFKSNNSDKFTLQTEGYSLLDQQSDSSFLKNVSSPAYLNYQSENIHSQNKRLSYIQRASQQNQKKIIQSKSKDKYQAQNSKKRPSNILIELGDDPNINKSPANKSASVSPLRKSFKPGQFSNPFYYSQTTKNSQNQSSKSKQIQDSYKSYLNSKK